MRAGLAGAGSEVGRERRGWSTAKGCGAGLQGRAAGLAHSEGSQGKLEAEPPSREHLTGPGLEHPGRPGREHCGLGDRWGGGDKPGQKDNRYDVTS